MIYYHSAIRNHMPFDFGHENPWKKWYNKRKLCHLIPFDFVLDAKFKPSVAKETALLKLLEQQKEMIPDSVFMLDCGAFTAYRQKFEIDVHDFIDFIKRHGGLWDTIVALDKINNPEGTWENYQRMCDAGIENVIPVYHVGEPDSSLEKYCATTNYVGFSPPFGLNGEDFVDVLHAQLYNKDGSLRFPDIKFHGFGVGSPIFFQAYPWHSCDSTNASIYGRYGLIIYYEADVSDAIKLKKIFVSGEQRKQKTHYCRLSPFDRQCADIIIQDIGFTINDLDEGLMPDTCVYKLALGTANRTIFNALITDKLVEAMNAGEYHFMPPPIRAI